MSSLKKQFEWLTQSANDTEASQAFHLGGTGFQGPLTGQDCKEQPQVSFMGYDLDFFDMDSCRVEPGPNPFGPRVLTM